MADEDPFSKLPDHLLIEIFIRVPVVELALASRRWANLFQDESLWYGALVTHFPSAAHSKPWPLAPPFPPGSTKRRYAALYVSKRLFSLDGEIDEIVGHTYLFLKDQLEIPNTLPPSAMLQRTIIDQFIASGMSGEKAHDLSSCIWLTVIENLEDNVRTFVLLKRLALEGDSSEY